MRRSLHVFAFAALAQLLRSPAVHADEPPPTDVRVRGDGPAKSASATTREEDILRAAPHRDGSELLSVLPGVFVTQHGGEGKAQQIFLRGFDAVHGQDLEIWVGGAPVNEVSNLHGQGYADLHFVMPEVVRSVSLQPGTFDLRQGDFAIAGTVRYELGLTEPGFLTKATFGSFGARRGVVAFRPEGSGPDTFAAAEAYSTDGFGPSRAALRGSAVAQVRHDLGRNLWGRVLAMAYTGRYDAAGVVLRRDVEAGRIDPYATYDPKQGGSSSRMQLVLELGHDGEGERWSVAPFVVLRSLTLRSNFTGFLEDPLNGDNAEQRNDAWTVGTTASYKKPVRLTSSRDTVEVGIYARHDGIEQSQRRLGAVDDRPTALLVDAGVQATDVAGYVDLALKPVPRLAIRGGVRVDALAYTSDDRLAALGSLRRSAFGIVPEPRITVDVGLAAGLRALASYGAGFRSPQARALADGEKTPFTRVHSFELGARYRTAGFFEGTLAVFHTRLSEDLAFDPVTLRNERTPPTARTGIALDIVARPAPWFIQATSFTFSRAVFTEGDAKIASGDLLPYAPQLVVRSDTAVTPRLGKLLGRTVLGRLGTGLSLLAARPLPYGEMGSNIFLVDASIGARWRELELVVDAYNVLGTTWFDGEFVYASDFSQGSAATLVPQRHVTVGAPRTVLATFAIHFGGSS